MWGWLVSHSVGYLALIIITFQRKALLSVTLLPVVCVFLTVRVCLFFGWSEPKRDTYGTGKVENETALHRCMKLR